MTLHCSYAFRCVQIIIFFIWSQRKRKSSATKRTCSYLRLHNIFGVYVEPNTKRELWTVHGACILYLFHFWLYRKSECILAISPFALLAIAAWCVCVVYIPQGAVRTVPNDWKLYHVQMLLCWCYLWCVNGIFFACIRCMYV